MSYNDKIYNKDTYTYCIYCVFLAVKDNMKSEVQYFSKGTVYQYNLNVKKLA